MDIFAELLLPAACGYCAGSVSFALLLARARGVDLRRVGSGNLGATNAGRALGRRAGVLVYLLDAAKGFVPALVFSRLLPDGWSGPGPGAAAGAAAFLGHIWPLYHGFRGGKGVATLSGAMLALAPTALGVAGAVLLATALLSRYMSLASLLFGAALPLAVWSLEPAAGGAQRPVFWLAVVGGGMIFWTHRANIGRLLAGTEHRLGGKKGRQRA